MHQTVKDVLNSAHPPAHEDNPQHYMYFFPCSGPITKNIFPRACFICFFSSCPFFFPFNSTQLWTQSKIPSHHITSSLHIASSYENEYMCVWCACGCLYTSYTNGHIKIYIIYGYVYGYELDMDIDMDMDTYANMHMGMCHVCVNAS